jgi:SAM-dependent methyltransferase
VTDDGAPASATIAQPTGSRVPWHEDPAFWTDLASRLSGGESAWERARVDAGRLATLLPTGARVLDLCCGAGRHAIALAARGFLVTAVDRTPQYLTEGRRRAAAAGVRVDFRQADARTYREPGSFDAVINMETSFGFFADPDDDVRVVAGAYRSLVDNGLLVMDMVGKEIRARNFVHRDWQQTTDALVLVERSVSDGWSYVQERWTIVDGSGRREYDRAFRMYSGAELESLLKACGFATVALHGGLAGEPYDLRARRLVAVARK